MTTTLEGLVISVSRRHAAILTPGKEIVNGTVSAKAMEVAVGDRVGYTIRNDAPFVSTVSESRRCLYRSYRGALRKMGANIDLLFIITAADGTFNLQVIDRMLTAAHDQSIPVCLIVNKADLGTDVLEPVVGVYRSLDIDVVVCSARSGSGLDEVRAHLDPAELRVAALAGVSGVGKSSILKKLVPEATCKVGALSERTGQGRQTTSQPQGYLYPSLTEGKVLLIDYPGIQFFGISHLKPTTVRDAFPEFQSFHHGCQFVGCMHTHEVVCGVKEAVEDGRIAPWRYSSYLGMLSEIEAAKPY